MIFTPAELDGCFVIDLDLHEDERGSFARTFCASVFADRGLDGRVEQSSVSRNIRRGTLRGLHFQCAPHGEAKLVRCTAGAIYDVAVDLRVASPTFRRWTAVVLSQGNGRSLYIPEGMAHGFVTLEPASEVSYQISSSFVPDARRGVRWDDPVLGIDWPDLGELTISEQDRTWPLLV